MLLLFVYALGLPLILLSTFCGRANRNSLFWRLLRGKGWVWNTHQIVPAPSYSSSPSSDSQL